MFFVLFQNEFCNFVRSFDSFNLRFELFGLLKSTDLQRWQELLLLFFINVLWKMQQIFLCWCTKTLKIFAKKNCLLLSFSFAVEQKTFTDLHTFLLISARMFLVHAKFENCIYSVCFMLSTFMFKNIFLCRVQTFLLRAFQSLFNQSLHHPTL